MLHLALTSLLVMQTASGSPTAMPTGTNPPASAAAPATGEPPADAPESPAAPAPASPTPPPTPRPTPPPAKRPTPAPASKASNDVLLVVNKSDNTVSLLDAATGRPRSTVEIEGGPHEVEMLADGKRAAVASYGRKDQPGRMVFLIDLATGKVVSRIDIGEGSRPHGLKALADGRLLVTAEGTRELVVVDTVAATVAARIPTGREVSHMVTASPDGKRAYVTSLSGSVTVIDIAGKKVVKDIPTGKGAEGLDATPDGREIWIANRDANTITIVDVKTLAPVFTIQAPSFPIRVRITPDGRRAVVAFTGSGDVGVYDTATRAQLGRVAIGRDAVAGTESRVFQKRFGASPAPVGLLISPDAKRAFVAASHADVVAVIDLEVLRVVDAWTSGKEPDGLAGKFGPPQSEEPKARPRPRAPTATTRRPPG